MDAIASQCASQSNGPVNQLFGLLIQAILAAQCNLSPEYMWPNDYGATAIQKGNAKPIPFMNISNEPWCLERSAHQLFEFKLSEWRCPFILEFFFTGYISIHVLCVVSVRV